MTDAHDLQRRRTMRRVFLTCAGVGVISAGALALAGFDGRAGFASLVLFMAFGSIVAALVGVAFAIVDEARRQRVSRRRAWHILAFFAGAVWGVLVLMALTAN